MLKRPTSRRQRGKSMNHHALRSGLNAYSSLSPIVSPIAGGGTRLNGKRHAHVSSAGSAFRRA